MACLNSDADKNNYQNFDVESNGMNVGMITDQQPPSVSFGRTKKNINFPLLASLIAVALGAVALVLSIYAAAVARRPAAGGDGGVLLTSNPSDIASASYPLFTGTGYFARLQPMLYSRSDHKTFPIGSTVYLVGGLTDARQVAAAEGGSPVPAGRPAVPLVLNATVTYNTYTERSQQQADMPEPRFRFCGAVLDGQLYVVGGMAKYESPDAKGHVVSDSAMRFNPATNTWQPLKGKLAHPRADCCAAAVGGKLYVAGGWTTDYADTLGSVEVYDPATDAWALLPANLTLPRGDCEAVAVDNRYMLVLGGVAPDGSFTSSVEALDTSAANPAWSPRANMTTPRGDFAAEALPGRRVIVMGGETSNGTATEFAMHQVEEYMFDHNIWVVKAPLPEARFRFDTAHVSNAVTKSDMVYVFGGEPTCASGDKGDGAKSPCVSVALNTTWGYFDVHYPELYALVKA